MDCRIIACNPLDSEPVVFSKETTPDVKISQAIRYSTSIPIVFGYKLFNGKPLVDGLISSNYPINIFDDNSRKTIGLRLVSNSRTACCFNKMSIFQYVIYLVNSLIIALEKEHIKDAVNAETINIDCSQFDPLNFDVSSDDKKLMFDLGYKAVMDYFGK
jgi:NTE family protein